MGHFYFVRHGETIWNMTNAEYAAFGVKNCAVHRYDFQ